jgi:hypothetical protein
MPGIVVISPAKTKSLSGDTIVRPEKYGIWGTVVSQNSTVPFGQSVGLNELKSLLNASKPTAIAGTRKVLIPIAAGLSEMDRYMLMAGMIGITEFHLILSSGQVITSPDPNPYKGLSGRLENGGTIKLKLEYTQGKNNPFAKIDIENHQTPGYEAVKVIIISNE